MKKNLKIGFVGQGWIGKNYADNFVERGYEVVRYGLEKEYKNNLEKLKDCRIVFVAVPTPSNANGFDDSILISAIKNSTFKNQIVVIKSTIRVGTTEKTQKLFPDRFIIHSPEFLTEKTARYDAANPDRNILGYTAKSKSKCGLVMGVLPCAPYENIVPCREAEFVKYMGNCWFYFKVLAMNAFYDIASAEKLDTELLIEMLGADKRVGRTHLTVVHQGGRGAGGDCFIKDFVSFREMYGKINEKENNLKSFGLNLIKAAEEYNKMLLVKTGKNINLLEGVYGSEEVAAKRKILEGKK